MEDDLASVEENSKAQTEAAQSESKTGPEEPDNQLLDLVTDPDPSNHTSPEKLRFGGWSEEDRKANDQKRRYSLGQLPSVF